MNKDFSRSQLLSTLSTACELEHGLACSYLYAAFSIKTDISEGLTWEEQQRNRLWASRIYHVAAQEMYHLCQAWNILIACGGVPYISKPKFPTPAKHFPLNRAALVLRKLDESTLSRFVYYESPHGTNDINSTISPSPDWSWPIEDNFPFSTVGELYEHCKNCITSIGKELFIGNPESQVGKEIVHFSEMLKVEDVDTALRAINQIIEQGEGNNSEHSDGHWDIFVKLKSDLSSIKNNSICRNVCDNPTLELKTHSLGSIILTPILNPITRLTCDLFNDVYIVMLQAISAPFFSQPNSEEQRFFAQSSIELMVTVLKPLGEACCLLPVDKGELMAGPNFHTERYVPFPYDLKIAKEVYKDRLTTLAIRGDSLLTNDLAEGLVGKKIANGVLNLRRLCNLI